MTTVEAAMKRTTGWVGLLLTIGLSGCGGGPEADTSGEGTAAAPAPAAPTAGRVLFEDALDDDVNGWALPESTEGRTTFEGGNFVWESKAENLRPHLIAGTLGDAFDRGELEMRDVVVRAGVTPVRGLAAVGVFCREVPDTDADFQWYEFVARDGYAAIRTADTAGRLDVLTKTSEMNLPTGERSTIEAACVDDAKGRGQLWMTVNGKAVLHATDDDPLGNGAPGLQAYDSPASAGEDRFLIRWHDFTVFAPAR